MAIQSVKRPEHALAFYAVPVERQSQAPQRGPECVGADLVVEAGPDGPDYTRYCDEHSWASHPAATPETTGRCPFCGVKFNTANGLTRWLRLKSRMGSHVG